MFHNDRRQRRQSTTELHRQAITDVLSGWAVQKPVTQRVQRTTFATKVTTGRGPVLSMSISQSSTVKMLAQDALIIGVKTTIRQASQSDIDSLKATEGAAMLNLRRHD
jgi:hypothetical protein